MAASFPGGFLVKSVSSSWSAVATEPLPLDAVPAAPSLPRCSLVQKEDATTTWTLTCLHFFPHLLPLPCSLSLHGAGTTPPLTSSLLSPERSRSKSKNVPSSAAS